MGSRSEDALEPLTPRPWVLLGAPSHSDGGPGLGEDVPPPPGDGSVTVPKQVRGVTPFLRRPPLT